MAIIGYILLTIIIVRERERERKLLMINYTTFKETLESALNAHLARHEESSS